MGCMVGVVGISWFKNHFLPDEKQELERERQTKILKTNKFYPDLPGGGASHQRQGESQVLCLLPPYIIIMSLYALLTTHYAQVCPMAAPGAWPAERRWTAAGASVTGRGCWRRVWPLVTRWGVPMVTTIMGGSSGTRQTGWGTPPSMAAPGSPSSHITRQSSKRHVEWRKVSLKRHE